MEAVYADPKRTIQQRTHTFYRLEKITIQHADAKFLKLLEEGGAQVIHPINKSLENTLLIRNYIGLRDLFTFIFVNFIFTCFFLFPQF